jgi:hypothetical protein
MEIPPPAQGRVPKRDFRPTFLSPATMHATIASASGMAPLHQHRGAIDDGEGKEQSTGTARMQCTDSVRATLATGDGPSASDRLPRPCPNFNFLLILNFSFLSSPCVNAKTDHALSAQDAGKHSAFTSTRPHPFFPFSPLTSSDLRTPTIEPNHGVAAIRFC